MAQKIESDKLVVKDVFSKWFRIPEYQRPYVWKKDQVTELLDDIMNACRNNKYSQYFLGSLVLKKTPQKEGNTSYDVFDLLDGQQRLTTLFLIICVIRDLSDNQDLKDACSVYLMQKENKFTGTPERIRIVFDIREQVKNFISSIIQKQSINSNDEDLGIKNMLIAIETIKKYFNKSNSITEFSEYLFNNVLLIYVCAEELEDAFRLFTNMNNRGVKLRNSDILKAENLGKIKEEDKRSKWAKNWEETENYFEEDFDAFLSQIRTILVKRKAQFSLLKEFEDNIYNPKSYDRNTGNYSQDTPLLERGEKTFELIENYKQHYIRLFDNCSDNELFNYLQLMQKGFEADFWIAPLLRYYEKFKDNNFLDFVKKLNNKFANDWILGESPTTRIENVNKIIQTIDDAQSAIDIISNDCLKINANDLKNTFSQNIYSRRAARYILLRLDMLYCGHNSKVSYPDIISIEHILPQTPNDSSQWKKDFTEEQREEWTNKIGNLILLSCRKNSSQGNKDFADKKDSYFKNNVGQFANSNRIMSNYTKWTLNEIVANQDEVIKKLIESF